MNNLIYKPFLFENPYKEETQINEETPYGYLDFIKERIPSQIFIREEEPEPVKITPLYEFPSLAESKKEVVTPVTQKQRGVLEMKHNDIDLGNMKELVELMLNEGISFRVTSGIRPGAMTKSGHKSHHSTGNAIDITPINGQSWEDLEAQLRNSPKTLAYMREHGYGILDETTKEMLARTGGTGKHWHIGLDRIAREQFNKKYNV